MESSNENLQKIRREEIPKTIAKYKSLVDGIFSEVAKDFPVFTSISVKNEMDDVIRYVSAEEQLYNFMKMREQAIDHADRMLNKINLLELELNAPELFKKLTAPQETQTIESKQPVKRNLAKENAKKD